VNFLDLLHNKKIVVLDGAMGTQLDKKGLMSRGGNNLDAPEAVREIHRAYVQAGCDALVTNTLTMNRVYVETHNVGVPVADVNRAGAALAREAAGNDRCVLGNMSSTGQLLEPYGSYTEAGFVEAFREQAQVLAEAGVDAFLIESMFDLREAMCALQACKEVAPLPALVSVAFQTPKDGGRTMMGHTADAFARHLTAGGADAIGANCGDLDGGQMAEVVAHLRATTELPIAAQPNAGKPRLVDDKTVFDMEPAPFAEGIAQCIEAGARIVGGCCGTTPAHIEAVRQVIPSM